MKGIIVTAAIAVAGCASTSNRPESMRPTERATGVGADEYPEAEYELRHTAEVRVWSRGAYVAKVDGRDRTVVHVGFEVENPTTAPLYLIGQAIAVTAVRAGERTVREPPLASLEGDLRVPPGEKHDFDFTFALPVGVDPQDVDAFDVRWAVTGEGIRHREITGFVEDEVNVYEPTNYAYRRFDLPFY
jgi:hypothetical protein